LPIKNLAKFSCYTVFQTGTAISQVL